MKKFLIIVLFLVILGAAVWFVRPFFHLQELVFVPLKAVKVIEKEIFSPPPLRVPGKEDYSKVILSKNEIIKQTNLQRENYGLNKLEENAGLDAMARAKVEEMFEKQYFAHQSPLGKEVGDLADDFGYQFLIVGENLAMGNFADEQDLVDSWMASPGHRANILNENYQEIGVAAEKGLFEGKTIWLAVQHFALSSAVCPEPSQAIESRIDRIQKELKELEETLNRLKGEIQKTRPKWGSAYQRKVEEYNFLAEEYNNLLNASKDLIQQYNLQVQEYNQCLVGLQ